MIWLLVAICFVISLSVRKSPNDSDASYTTITVLVVIAGCFVVNAVCGVLITETISLPSVVVESTSIISLDAVPGASGHFSLGFGTIDNTEVYYYYVSNQDGSFSLKHTEDADVIRVFQTSDTSPRVDRLDTKPSWWLLASWNLSQSGYNIYIPEGSIIEHYDMNIGTR